MNLFSSLKHMVEKTPETNILVEVGGDGINLYRFLPIYIKIRYYSKSGGSAEFRTNRKTEY